MKPQTRFAGVLQALRDQGIIGGWRDELYPVTNNFYSEPLFLVSDWSQLIAQNRSLNLALMSFLKFGDQDLCLKMIASLHTSHIEEGYRYWANIVSPPYFVLLNSLFGFVLLVLDCKNCRAAVSQLFLWKSVLSLLHISVWCMDPR